MSESHTTVAPQSESDVDGLSSPSPSILTLPGSIASSNELPDDDVCDQHDILLPCGVPGLSSQIGQGTQGRSSPLIFEENLKISDHKLGGYDQGDSYSELGILGTQASSAYHIPVVDPGEHEKPKLDLSQPVVILPSPFSPSESIRPMTPPFRMDDESDSRPTSPRLVEADDDRKPSASRVNPADAVFLSPPIPFPDQRRYSLADLGQVTVPSRGRRTLSDVGAIARSTRPGTEGSIDNANVTLASGPESLPMSRPSTARFSTFAEMGIQSFAMAKGGKTVESRKKDATGNDKKRQTASNEQDNRSLEHDSAVGMRNEGADDVASNAPAAPPIETYDNRRKHKASKFKSADCIIM